MLELEMPNAGEGRQSFHESGVIEGEERREGKAEERKGINRYIYVYI
jgi:hypothetical protein